MTALPAAALRTATCCVIMMLAGCATTGERNAADPFESANRKVYAFNDGVDRYTLKPTAKAYEKAVPKLVRTSVTNFFTNLDYPITIVNQLLQGKLKAAGQDTLRFAMNTTLGIGGLFDPASDANLPRHDEDFGQTLGKWGVPAGPYVMLPLLGPSHLRDVPSHVFNRFVEPFYWYDYGSERWISLGLSLVDKRARLLPLEPTLARTYDPYGFIRDAYTQRRLFQVYDGDIPESMLPKDEDAGEEFDEETPAPDEPTQDGPPPDGPPQDEPQPD
jgi:phospholipid-binding lipoprotein MlaA